MLRERCVYKLTNNFLDFFDKLVSNESAEIINGEKKNMIEVSNSQEYISSIFHITDSDTLLIYDKYFHVEDGVGTHS